MSFDPSTRRLLVVAAGLALAVSVSGAQATAAPDKAELRSALLLAYAKTFSAAEILIGATKPYSVACNDPKSYTTLMMIDMMISRALEVKKAIATSIAAAAAAATPDSAAHQLAEALVGELDAFPQTVASIMAPAQRCKEFMQEKDRAADAASSDGDMTWNAARSHASINVMRLEEFDVTAELKDARLLVTRTK